MTVTWLHVSDIHLKVGDHYGRDRALRALVKAVGEYRTAGHAAQLIFATGDIAYSGKAEEYDLAYAFFDELLEAAGLDRRQLFVVPGNHDVDRSRGVGLVGTLSEEEADAYFQRGSPKPHITDKQAAFAAWYDQYFKGIRIFPRDTTCGPLETVSVDDARIGILAINSALFSQGDRDHEKLLIGRRCLDEALCELPTDGTELRIALVHHPLDWLSASERANVKAKLQRNFDIVLRGHLHETEVEAIATGAGAILHIAAGAAYQGSTWPQRALYASFDGTSLTVYPIRYEDKPNEVWTVDPSLFPDREADGFANRFPVPRLAGVPPADPLYAPTGGAASPRRRSVTTLPSNTMAKAKGAAGQVRADSTLRGPSPFHPLGSMAPGVPSYVPRTCDRSLQVAARSQAFIWVKGDFQSGKTSLLYRHGRWLPPGWLAVYADMVFLAETKDRFMSAYLDVIAKATTTFGSGAVGAGFDWATVAGLLKDHRIAFLVDEIGSCSEEQMIRLIAVFHGLFDQSPSRIRVVVPFTEGPDALLPRGANPKYTIQWKIVPLGPFTTGQVRLLLRLFPDPLFALLSARISVVRAKTGFQPHKVQKLLDDLWKDLSSTGRSRTATGPSLDAWLRKWVYPNGAL